MNLTELIDRIAAMLRDRLGVSARMRPVAEYNRNLSGDALLEIVNEVIRVRGLSMVVNGRDDVITEFQRVTLELLRTKTGLNVEQHQ
jgi:hypothetical protein